MWPQSGLAIYVILLYVTNTLAGNVFLQVQLPKFLSSFLAGAESPKMGLSFFVTQSQVFHIFRRLKFPKLLHLRNFGFVGQDRGFDKKNEFNYN